MVREVVSIQPKNRHCLIMLSLIGVLVVVLTAPVFAGLPEGVMGIYLPAGGLFERRFNEMLYYAELAQLNTFVIHAKDPRGYLHWRSKHPLATEIGAVNSFTAIEHVVPLLKRKGIWTVAKLDVFQDSLLVKHRPDWGVFSKETGLPWQDNNGMLWANPYDQRVWAYNIALAEELVGIGFEEIQFDYIRFPTDGNLSDIRYPTTAEKWNKARCIGDFLKTAYATLKSLGVTISVDVFGLTAWKKKDFGVGQVIENIAPYVDVICPMLYPSHFPKGFLGWKEPAAYPMKILDWSIQRLKKRTQKKIRPWIQAFWYSSEEISAQLKGIALAGVSSWTAWNSSGDYRKLMAALSKKLQITFPKPVFYPSLTELEKQSVRTVRGRIRIVNHTDYHQGYSVLSLEAFAGEARHNYTTPIQVIGTLDEAILDRILTCRSVSMSRAANKFSKVFKTADLLIRDLDVDPRRMQPGPFYIDWRNDCRFTYRIPSPALQKMLAMGRVQQEAQK